MNYDTTIECEFERERERERERNRNKVHRHIDRNNKQKKGRKSLKWCGGGKLRTNIYVNTKPI